MKQVYSALTSIFFFVVLGFLFPSCQEKLEFEIQHEPLIRLKYSNALIKGLTLYGFHEYTARDTTFAAYINHRNLTLYISNFNTPEAQPQKIKLDATVFNVDSFGFIRNFSIDKNKMAFLQPKRIGLYNLKTHLLEFERKTEGTEEEPIFFNISEEIPLLYIDSLNEIYIQCADFSQEGQYLYDVGFQCKVNTKSGKSKVLPINYPPSFGDGSLGLSGFVSCSYKGDTILYNFSSEEYFVVYDKSNNELTKVKAKSKYHKELAQLNAEQLNDYDKQVELRSTAFTYNSVFYDRWSQCYYRIYSKDQALKNKEGFYNTDEARKEGVIVLNSDFEVLGEFEIPEDDVSIFNVSERGIIYPLFDTTLDAHLDYAAIKVNL